MLQVVQNGKVFLKGLTNIEAGEELSYSCASIGVGSEEDRKRAILDNWGFICSCLRCSNEMQGDKQKLEVRVFDESHVCCCGAVCYLVEKVM